MSAWASVWGVLMAAAAFLFSLPARSEGGGAAIGVHRVVVLEPASRNDFELEVLARVRGELRAAGFAVSALAVPEVADPWTTVETAARDLAPAAVLMILAPNDRPGSIRVVDLWLSDWSLHRTLVQELEAGHADPNRRAAQMAVMAVEALRAHFAEFAIVPEPAPPPPAAAVEPSAVPTPSAVAPANPPEPPRGPQPPRPAAAASDRIEIEAAIGVLQGFRGIGSAAAPIARLGWILPRSSDRAGVLYELRASVSAFGRGIDVTSNGLTARVHQSFGTLDGVVRVLPDLPVEPFFSLGGGAYAVDVAGHAPAPYQIQSTRTWSALGTLGAGVWVRPMRHFVWILEAQLMTALSRTVVRIDGVEAAQAGLPAVALSTGLSGVF